eukprot:scaffold31053_cov92-Amphora_coffeaeformis.AAC.1
MKQRHTKAYSYHRRIAEKVNNTHSTTAPSIIVRRGSKKKGTAGDSECKDFELLYDKVFHPNVIISQNKLPPPVVIHRTT